MSIYRTALGKTLDMTRLASQNEHVRAVGNMNVNARGDTIDSHGKVVVPVTKKVGDAYQRSVATRAANIVRHSNEAATVDEVVEQEVENTIVSAPIVDEPVVMEELHPDEIEFEDDNEADEIEALKAAENIVIKPASEAPDFVMPDVTTKKK